MFGAMVDLLFEAALRVSPFVVCALSARRLLRSRSFNAVLYAALGTLQFAKPPKFLSKSPFDMDLALRAVALGWFDSKRTIPVTIVDIDEETHRSWGSPAITPRAELIGIFDEPNIDV